MASLTPLRYPVRNPIDQPAAAQPRIMMQIRAASSAQAVEASGQGLAKWTPFLLVRARRRLYRDSRQGYEARYHWGDRAHFSLHRVPGASVHTDY